MLADHVGSGAAVTVACIEVDRQEARDFGVMAVDDSRKVVDFVEKPAEPPCIPGKPDRSLASMGIYIFSAEYLYQALEEDLADPNSSTISARTSFRGRFLVAR
jgi:glucose-1-phosphate adenylyltransferase